MARLDDRRILVVDAAAPIGRAACAALAAEGARVMVGDPDAEAARSIAQELGHGAGSVALDPLDATSCEQALLTTVDAFGALDVLCNRAPHAPAARKLLHELSEAEWRGALDDGLQAVALPTRFALRAMHAQGAGAIIVIGSSAGLVGVPRLAGFSAASAGLVNFTRNVALEARRAGHAIRANMLCLGSTSEPLVPGQAETVFDPTAIAPVLVFLASPDSAHLNASVLAADDGLSAWR